jgi:hypothetical protein
MQRYAIAIAVLATVAGCASDPNLRWFEGARMGFAVTELGPEKYRLDAYGAGAHTKQDVERGFLMRAGELCSPRQFKHEVGIYPSSYTGDSFGYRSTFKTLQAIGTVTCI